MATSKMTMNGGMSAWMLRTLFGLLVAVILAWAGFLHAQIGDLRAEDRGLHQRLNTTKDRLMDRVSSLEPAIAAMQADVATVKTRLENIESKLDKVLLRRRSQ